MADMPEFVIPPETKFSDIIVPTMDTISSAHILEMLLTNNKTVSIHNIFAWDGRPVYLYKYCIVKIIMNKYLGKVVKPN